MGQDTHVEKEDDRPKWLLELENRKRKPRLAHEVGAGAPCIKCNSSCPGLDLHFWRKICKNCKCGRDDHDVPDDEFLQFDLLFGPSGNPKRRAIVLKINKQQTDNEETFEWAPPDTTKELAADYMKALPQDKLPIKGSVGAALRKQQLQKQLPLHDIDHKVCDELSESERKQFEKYLENIKNYVGQGKVTKIITAKPFEKSLITPANASECFSPKHKANLINSQPANLRTPSSFVPKSMKPPLKSSIMGQEEFFNANQNLNNNLGFNNGNGLLINDPQAVQAVTRRLESVMNPALSQAIKDASKYGSGRYHHILDNMKNGEKIVGSSSVSGIYNPAMNLAYINKLPQEVNFSSIGQLNNGSFDKVSGNISASCGQENQPYDKSGQENVHNYLAKGSSNVPGQVGYAENLESIQQVPEYLASTNSVPFNRDNPSLNFAQTNLLSDNELNNVSNSLPYQPAYQRVENVRPELAKTQGKDSEPLKSHPWAKKWIKGNEDSKLNHPDDENSILVDKMLSDALLPPSSIHSSDIIGSTLDPKELSYIREKLASKYNAKEEPVELINSLRNRELKQDNYLDDKNLHKVHAEANHQTLNANTVNQNNSKPAQAQFSSYKNPGNSLVISESLSNPVFPEEAVGTSQTMDNPNVDRLGGGINNLTISQSKFKVQKCHQCQDGIFVGDVVVTAEKAKDAAWHPGCFVCSECSELLVDLVYFYYKGKLYCARDLANLLGIPRCFACDELIFVREYTVAEGHNYHVKHFCCWDCDMPLAGQQYISENDRPLCLPCYQRTYAKTCCTCKNLIAADQQGVGIKDLNFHASDKCFCCASCKKSLLNGRMAIKEDKPFCSKECIIAYLNQSRC